MRADVADDHLTVIDADAHAQSHPALLSPAFVKLAQLAAHPQGRVHAALRILRRAETAHVAPHRHDRVADEFVERSAIAENDGSHA